MEWNSFVSWAFPTLISGCLVIAVGLLSKLVISIADLNTKIAVIIEKISGHETRITNLEKNK